MYESELVGTDWLWFGPGGIQGPQKNGDVMFRAFKGEAW